MSENPPSILGALPSARTHRRSDKRSPRAGVAAAAAPGTQPPAAKPASPKRKRPAQPKAAAPKGAAPKNAAPKAEQRSPRPTAPQPGKPRPVQPTPSIDVTELAGTAVKAVAELAEIGLSAGARALKLAVARLPRP